MGAVYNEEYTTLFLKSNGIGQPFIRVLSPLSPLHFAEFSVLAEKSSHNT